MYRDSPGIKRPRRDVNHSFPSTADVEKLPLRVHGLGKDSYAFPFFIHDVQSTHISLQARGTQAIITIKSDTTGNRKARTSKFHLSAVYSQSLTAISIVFARVYAFL